VAIEAGLALADILAGTGGTLVASVAGELRVAGVSIDSRTVAPRELFVAIKGPRFDGHDFLVEATARAAAAAMVHREVVPPRGLPLVRVGDTTRALGELARHVRRQVEIPVVGITGSVGKTTTKGMAAHLLATKGPVLGSEGNLNNRYGLPLTLLRLRAEQEKSADENARLLQEIEAMRGRLADVQGATAEIDALRQEREAIRHRVADMLSHLEAI